MKKTRFHTGAGLRLVLGLLALSSCDAGDAEAQDTDVADEDLEERGWGCALLASSPPAVDKTYFSDGGKSNGGCDLFVIARKTPVPTTQFNVVGTAYSRRPIVTTEARLWARTCAGNNCSGWTMFDDQPYGWFVGPSEPACDPDGDEPCLWAAIANVRSNPYEYYNEFRFGISVVDDEGEPAYVRLKINDNL
jgi:hypothetical protein